MQTNEVFRTLSKEREERAYSKGIKQLVQDENYIEELHNSLVKSGRKFGYNTDSIDNNSIDMITEVEK